MADLHSKWVNGHLVYYDTNLTRWLDVIGPSAVGIKEEFVKSGIAIAAADASPLSKDGWTLTFVEVGAGGQLASLVAGADGGQLLLTTAGNEDDGINMQLAGEAFSFASAWPAYFGMRFKVSEATQSDFLMGLCITDTTLTAGLSDGVYFRKADGATAVSAVIEKNTTETTGAAWTCAADTWVTAEIFFDGTNVDFYVNGTQLARMAQTNLPNDEYLTPSFEFLNGNAASRTINIDWIRAFQIQA